MVVTCKRCGVTCTSVEKFGLHQRLHSNVATYRVCCGFQNCNREFSTYAAFKAHAYRNHLTSEEVQHQQEQISEFYCEIPDCTERFNRMKQLLSHLHHHIRVDGSTLTCPYDKCEKQYKKRSSFSSYLCRNHYQSSADTNIDVGNPLRTVHSIHQEQNVQGPEVNNCLNDDNDIQIYDAVCS